jgi:magnesium-transporting ATPase (P-type)
MSSAKKQTTTHHAEPWQEVISHLNSNLERGLDHSQIPGLQKIHGPNELTEEEHESLWDKIKEQFEDIMVRLLLMAALISFVVNYFTHDEEEHIPPWVEPSVIFVILIANGGIGIY